MRIFQRLLVLSLLSFSLYSCTAEYIDPVTLEETPELAESGLGGHHHIQYPSNPCGIVETSNLVDDAGNDLGDVEIINDIENLYIISHLDHGWLFTDMKVYAGKKEVVPVDRHGDLEIEEFGYQLFVGRWANEMSTRIPMNRIGSCSDLVVWAKIAEVDWFGNTIGTKIVWLDGSTLANGKYYNYCKHTCAATASTSTI